MLTKIETCAAKYGLNLNQSKCETINTDTGDKSRIAFKDGGKVQRKNMAKYLGCKLNNKSEIQKELNSKMKDCVTAWKKLETFWKHSNVDKRRKILIYNSDAVLFKPAPGKSSPSASTDFHVDSVHCTGLRICVRIAFFKMLSGSVWPYAPCRAPARDYIVVVRRLQTKAVSQFNFTL